jgi:aprataxin
VHFLLLPRHQDRQLLHPFDALADEPFLAEVRVEAEKLRQLAANELRRRVGRRSRQERARNEVLDRAFDGDDPRTAGETATTATASAAGPDATGPASSEAAAADLPDELPPGRDYAQDIMVGVHARPSMDHLHVHVLSRELHSECVKHRKHYNSFATGFFVPLADFPLAPDDPRREPERAGFLKSDFVCWRCGKGFGNRFKELKDHLETEFQAWAAE